MLGLLRSGGLAWNEKNQKLANDLVATHAESKKNYDKGKGWTTSEKYRGCYIVDLHTLFGSSLDTEVVWALRQEDFIRIDRVKGQTEKNNVEWQAEVEWAAKAAADLAN